MNDRIIPAPDISDERLAELVDWTGKAGMPDVHALLLDLKIRRSTDRDAEFVALRKALWVRLEQCQKQAERIRELENDALDLRAGIIALLDSDAPSGELRRALAELVGRK